MWDFHFLLSCLQLTEIEGSFNLWYNLSFFFLATGHVGILVSRPSIRPLHPTLGAQNLNYWTIRKVVQSPLFFFSFRFHKAWNVQEKRTHQTWDLPYSWYVRGKFCQLEVTRHHLRSFTHDLKPLCKQRVIHQGK